MKTLKFNSSAACEALEDVIRAAADRCLNEFYSEIESGLNTSAGKSDLEKMSKDEEKIFIRQVIGKATAIMDSYGTGSEMDESNPFLSAYKQSSLWNTLRSDNAIAGRSAGYYVNIYGSRKLSSGALAGFNIEDKIRPREPSYAFQRAEEWWFVSNGRISEILTAAIEDWCNGLHRFFTYS